MKHYFKESVVLLHVIAHDEALLGMLQESVDSILECFKRGNKLLIAGNGGSAADAQHFSAEMVGRYKKERKAYPAIALTVDTSVLTAWSNDYSFDTVFSRQIEALGKEGDIFVGISTSGNSTNLLEATKTAKEMGMQSICLLGHDGGALKSMCDRALTVPSDNTPRIQEVHGMLIHIICEEVEQALTVREFTHQNQAEKVA